MNTTQETAIAISVGVGKVDASLMYDEPTVTEQLNY